jgi:hypothetical protein
MFSTPSGTEQASIKPSYGAESGRKHKQFPEIAQQVSRYQAAERNQEAENIKISHAVILE